MNRVFFGQMKDANTLTLPLVLQSLTPEEVTWLASKSAQAGRSTAEIVHDLLRDAAERCGFTAAQTEPAK